MKKIYTYDTTLRDGAQSGQVSFSKNDKLNIIKLLDSLGLDYIEVGGYDGDISDGDAETENSELVLFSSTTKPGTKPEDDVFLSEMAKRSIKNCAVYGKAWSFQVSEVLGTTCEENLRMIRDTVAYLKDCGKFVFFDAEHFFDGWKNDREYAEKVLDTALSAGADRLVLCDTNGGTFPDEISDIINKLPFYGDILAIHAHDDCGLAVADSVAAVLSGAATVEGTLTGFGERCGNANLSTVIPNLQIKKDYFLLPTEKLRLLTGITRSVSHISNISVENMPYIGSSAFSHKAGTHIDAVMKNPNTFEHIDPAEVGNRRNTVLSDLSGKSAVLTAVKKIYPDIDRDSEVLSEFVKKIKNLEGLGFGFENAQASLELLIKRSFGKYQNHFDLMQYKVIDEHDGNTNISRSFSFIEVAVGGRTEMAAAGGDGPVEALDMALRKALYSFYPSLKSVKLIDYKVGVMDRSSTGSTVRVSIFSSDGKDVWSTVGVSADIIEASEKALADSIEYKLSKDGSEIM